MPTGTRATEILLIEDDPSAANLFLERVRHFAPGEFNVTQARTLQSGLEEAVDVNFGLAVLDLTLPDSTGIETCSKFNSAQPNVPFIVLTGVADGSLAETLSKAGAIAAFSKEDCLGQDLLNAVRSAAITTGRQSVDVTTAVSEARFRNAIIDSADGIVVIGESGDIVLVSSGAESLLGRSAADLTGSPLGIDLQPGTPVRAQMLREEQAHEMVHVPDGPLRQFDVCKLQVSEVEFWPFSHRWANKPVTVCAMRDINNQSAEETRQRNIVRIDEPLQVSAGIDAVCADIAVRLGALVKFNRFEAGLWRPDLNRLQVMAELGIEAEGREVSTLQERGSSPAEFASWSTEWSAEEYGTRVAVSVGSIEPDVNSNRNAVVLARCASMIASALTGMKRKPVLAPAESDESELDRAFELLTGRTSSMPGAA